MLLIGGVLCRVWIGGTIDNLFLILWFHSVVVYVWANWFCCGV